MSTGFDAVLIIVDKLSNIAVFEPVKKSYKAEDVAQCFDDRLFSKHGVPIRIISDRDRNLYIKLLERANRDTQHKAEHFYCRPPPKRTVGLKIL